MGLFGEDLTEEKIDEILRLAVEKKQSKAQISKKGHSKRVVTRIIVLLEKNKHKMEAPKTASI